MNLVTFTHNDHTRIGIQSAQGIIDLSEHEPALPTDMREFLATGSAGMNLAANAASNEADFSLADVTLQAPILRPGKILAIGLNYRAHALESDMEIPKYPVVFTKQSTSVNGPFDPVHWSEESKLLDYEGELGIVIGKRCRRVSASQAPDVIAGYTIVNDVSVRNWQLRGATPQFTMGKSWDTHCPVGPAIVVSSDIDPHNLQLKTYVNGELRQDTSTSDLIFNCYDLVAFLSTAFTLEPGDVIATGTPSGVGAAMQPAAWLKPGDTVRVSLTGLGHIENRIVEEPANFMAA